MRPARASDPAFLREQPRAPSRPRLPDPALAAVGTTLRTARNRRGIGQADVAAFASVTVRTVQAWESGRERVPPERAEALARFLDLAPGALDGAAHIARTPAERAALAAYRVATAEGKVMTFEPATDRALRETGEAYARAGIVPAPAAPAEDPAQIFPPAVRLVAILFAAACALGVGFANPWVLAALAPVLLVLGVGLAQALFDLARARAARAAPLPAATE